MRSVSLLIGSLVAVGFFLAGAASAETCKSGQKSNCVPDRSAIVVPKKIETTAACTVPGQWRDLNGGIFIVNSNLSGTGTFPYCRSGTAPMTVTLTGTTGFDATVSFPASDPDCITGTNSLAFETCAVASGTFLNADGGTGLETWNRIGGIGSKKGGKPPGGCCVGDPINAGTGNVYTEETDYSDRWLRFARFYNSDPSTPSDTIGSQWRHTYSRKVVFSPGTPTVASVSHEDGKALTFNFSGGVWVPDADVHDTLIEQTDASGNVMGWTYARADTLTTETYNASGSLLGISDADGFITTLTYSNPATSPSIAPWPNLLLNVTDPIGRSLQFQYDLQGNISTMSDPAGQVYTYNYDAAGTNTLTTVTYPGIATPRTYVYNESTHTANTNLPNAITGIVDENNARFDTWDYKATGQAIDNFQGVGSNKSKLTYNVDGSTTVVGPLGLSTKHLFATMNGVSLPSGLSAPSVGFTDGKSRTYDTFSNETSVSDFSASPALTCKGYAIPANGLQTSEVDGVTKPGTCANPSTGLRTIQTDWYTALRKPKERRTLDAAGTLVGKVGWIYNTRGQVQTQTQTDPVTNALRTTTMTYCESADVSAVGSTCPILGLLKSVDGPRTDVSDVTTYAYYPTTDQSGCATQGGICHDKGDLNTVTSAANGTVNLVTTYLTYDGAGRPLSMTDTNGVETDMTYSARGWLTQHAVRATGNSTVGEQITGYQHDNIGQITRITQPDSSYLGFIYDTAHRLTDITDNVGNTIHYKLDNAGNRTEDDTKDPTLTIKRKIVRAFNTLSQLKNTYAAYTPTPTINATYAYDLNGNFLKVTDGLTHLTSNTYDPLYRLTLAVQDAGTTGLKANINYTYDALNRLTQVKDPQGLNTIYQFDGLNNQTQLSSPDTGIATSTPDAAGNVLTRTDARNVIASYSYDALNRPTGITYPTPALNVTFAYDIAESGCPSTATFAKGHLTHFKDASSGSSTTKLCYDRFGNMVFKSQVTSGLTFKTTYAYDPAHHLTQITTPMLTLIKYTRDSLGRITGVTYTPKNQTTPITVVSNVTYYPYGPVASITYGTGASSRTLTRTYDQDYVVSSIADPGAGGLALTFVRDVMGDLKQMQIGGSTSTVGNLFTYNGLYRLTKVTDLNSALVAAFPVDTTGNRTGKQDATGAVVPYTYTPNTHHLLAIGSTSPIMRSYNNDGDTTAIGSGTTAQNFFYDDTARMTQMRVGPTLQMQYLYNARGERVRKYLGTNTTYTVYDASGHVLGDYASATVPIREMIWMDSLPVGVLNGATGTLAYIEPDQIGTPRVAIDAVRNVAVWTWSPLNDAFGESAPNQDPDADGAAFVFNLRMPGQVWDAESGLSYNYFRDYDAGTGRYVESDPIGLGGGISTYAYANLNPLWFGDSLGLVTLNWIPFNTQQNTTLHMKADNYNPTGVFTFAAHGNPIFVQGLDGIIASSTDPDGTRDFAEPIANAIFNNPAYHNLISPDPQP